MDYSSLDDAASAALWSLMSAPREHMGALYREGDGFGRTPTVTTNSNGEVSGKLSVPPGSLAALFHNHPLAKGEMLGRKGNGEDFSPDDRAQAIRLGKPSYIQTPNMNLRRFDPNTGRAENVLAQIPIDQIREKYMADTIQHSPAITAAQRRAMVEAMLAQAQQQGPPSAPPMPQGPPPAMDMGGAPQPLPPGANTFGPPMGPPPVPSADQEAMRRAQIAQAIRQAAAGAPR